MTLRQAQLLQMFAYCIEHASLGPTAQAGIVAVPMPVMRRHCSPFTVAGCHIQDGVERIEVVDAHIARLTWQ